MQQQDDAEKLRMELECLAHSLQFLADSLDEVRGSLQVIGGRLEELKNGWVPPSSSYAMYVSLGFLKGVL